MVRIRDTIPMRDVPAVKWLLIAANVLVFGADDFASTTSAPPTGSRYVPAAGAGQVPKTSRLAKDDDHGDRTLASSIC